MVQGTTWWWPCYKAETCSCILHVIWYTVIQSDILFVGVLTAHIWKYTHILLAHKLTYSNHAQDSICGRFYTSAGLHRTVTPAWNDSGGSDRSEQQQHVLPSRFSNPPPSWATMKLQPISDSCITGSHTAAHPIPSQFKMTTKSIIIPNDVSRLSISNQLYSQNDELGMRVFNMLGI
jgi:hypothetical protein